MLVVVNIEDRCISETKVERIVSCQENIEGRTFIAKNKNDFLLWLSTA